MKKILLLSLALLGIANIQSKSIKHRIVDPYVKRKLKQERRKLKETIEKTLENLTILSKTQKSGIKNRADKLIEKELTLEKYNKADRNKDKLKENVKNAIFSDIKNEIKNRTNAALNKVGKYSKKFLDIMNDSKL